MAQRLEDLSLQMLMYLQTLIMERSVSKAADQLGLSQSSMSKVLGKLRSSLGDPLLVRTAHGMVPTERALHMTDAIRQHLTPLESALSVPMKFRADRAVGRVTVTAADAYLMLLFPEIVKEVRRRAPGVTLATRHIDKTQIKEWLEEGTCDLAIGTFEQLDPALRVATLYSESFVCLVSESHPSIKDRLTLAEYLQARHVVFHHPLTKSGAASDVIVDTALGRNGVRRTAGAQIHSSLAWGYVVAQTDLVATLSRPLARFFASFLPVKMLEPPVPIPPLSIAMVWHERTHRLALHRWLRGTLRSAVANAPGILDEREHSRGNARLAAQT